MKKPSAILTSDWHLRETTPTCRTDDFWKAQWDKVDWIAELQRQYDCPVLHAGDLFDHWKPSPYLLSMAIEHLPDMFCTIYGQHDLPQHSFDLHPKSGIHTLEKAGKIDVLLAFHWGMVPDKNEVFPGIEIKGKYIAVWHNFTYIGKEPWPGCTATQSHVLLEKYKQFDLIVTGDNHQSFHVRGTSGNLLVNPGNLTRQKADQKDFRPRVFLWYAEDNSVEAIEIPASYDVVTREHIDKVQERDERIDAFISRLDTEWEMELNFEENMKRFFSTNRMRREIKEIILKSMEND
jgi:DNA repair exonuclease SbcCD nuclease subunit